ncbi:hypothetical protein GCM10010331_71640 [Streptomyces xanthochromogenes]|nr:hypothetical protein GCM10010331_71640 [Streptomyces xanthochromogenes]
MLGEGEARGRLSGGAASLEHRAEAAAFVTARGPLPVRGTAVGGTEPNGPVSNEQEGADESAKGMLSMGDRGAVEEVLGDRYAWPRPLPGAERADR